MHTRIVGTGDVILGFKWMMKSQSPIGALANEQPMLTDDQLPVTVDNGEGAGLHAERMDVNFAAVPVLLDQFLTENIEPPDISAQWIVAGAFAQFCYMVGKQGSFNDGHFFLPRRAKRLHPT